MFMKIYHGPLKALYVLTSQLNPYSEKYNRILRVLLAIHEKYGEQIPIVIVPNDEIARKLGILRDKNLRKFRTPEVRFLDFGKLIGTEKIDGKLPIIDCSENKNTCSDMVDTHYTRKHNFDKEITEEYLEEFIKQSLKGDFQQFYETDTTPCTSVRKLCARDFVS